MPDRNDSAGPSDDRVSTGSPELDRMLDGGLMPHRPYLLIGPSGTGKTTLALSFLSEGVRRGERGLVVTLEEPPNEMRINHRALAPDLDRVDVFDAIPDVMRYERVPFKDIAAVRHAVPFASVPYEIRKTPELSSVEVTIAALEQMLRTEVQRRGYTRLVIDSLTALQYFCMKGFDPVGGAQTFLRFLSDLRTTTLLIVESPLEDSESPERMLARGEIRLFRWELDGMTVRAVGVEKFRGSAHDVRLHPYRIGRRGGIDINLDVTISRDTRQILAPAAAVVAAGTAPMVELPVPSVEPLSAALRDLAVLDVDLGPVREEVEAALAAARGPHPAEAATHVARISSLALALGRHRLDAGAPPDGAGTPGADAFRRLAQRAEAARAGLPPTRLPEPDVLEGQLTAVLQLLSAPMGPPSPSAAPAPKSPPQLPPSPPPGAAPLAPPVPAAPPPAAAPVAPSPAPPSTPPEAPPTAAPAPAPVRVPAPPPPASAPPTEPPRPPPRARATGPIPEPPPLPPTAPRARSVPTRAAAPVATSAPPETAPGPPSLPQATPPPAAELPSAAPKRKRRAPARKAETPAPDASAAPEAPGDAPPKVRRRAVRRKRAPPVVAATVEAPPSEGPPDPPPSGEAP